MAGTGQPGASGGREGASEQRGASGRNRGEEVVGLLVRLVWSQVHESPF